MPSKDLLFSSSLYVFVVSPTSYHSWAGHGLTHADIVLPLSLPD